MREIKFRAWDKKNKVMIFGGFVNFSTPLLDASINFSDMTQHVRTAHPSAEYELMQYTGLKDKNGKEIYEGDVVKQIVYHDEKQWYITEVIFNRGRFCLNTGTIPVDLFPELCEIIGNIYESPELLNQ